MSDLPAPLTPPECDLRTMPSLPVDVVRLMDSHMVILSTGPEFKAAMMLFFKSWCQVPAGSLPDDDRILADLSRAGAAWGEVKEAALRNWIKCSDGRLYHPVVAEKARAAWDLRLKQRKKAQARWGGDETGVRTSDDSSRGHAAACAAAMQVNGNGNGNGNGIQQAAAAQTEQEPVPSDVVPLMPKRGDPPERWMHLGEKTEIDDRGVRRPVVSGYYLDGAADQVCHAARINSVVWRGDWRPLVGWLRDGIDLPIIIEVIGRIAARRGYTPPVSLKYFDGAVREKVAA